MRHRLRLALVVFALAAIVAGGSAALAGAAAGKTKSVRSTKVARAHMKTRASKANCPNM